ncbi:hypothetical protein EXU57_22815 [Segetibacter sp. 3557_3]|uniref:acyloxyacyl hydrolase n=1 Tax=Segetibacter sp. 3557_3 TaxID=2547429 RepID=UPI001058EF81|nr:acyloxyacyl hydrolase [Segetibacter sp. 3557_3]TDH19736.1 hypothetical protein EXU57_22815 [Segetibacter sp. 3557_3]
MRFLFCIVNLLAFVLHGFAQAGASRNSVQARLHYGFILAHTEAVQNTSGARPIGLEVELTKQKTDTATWNLCRCYPIKGWNLSYVDFDSKILGSAATLGYFIQPSYRLGLKSQFSLKGGVGLSYLSNPWHPQTNPSNQSYSTRVSGFLQFGLAGGIQVAPKWLLQAGLHYQHVSNGGFKEPNKGINWPTASIGVASFKTPYGLPAYNRRIKRDFRGEKPYVEAGLFFSAKQGTKPNGTSPRTPLAGAIVQVEKQVSSTDALNAGIEVYYDNALNQRLKSDSLTASAVRGGILAGHNFLLGRFFFGQQLGVYLYNQTPYYNRLYHRWTLRYLLRENLSAGIGLKVHRHIADFIDLRVMYRL